jgi:tripartite-type tricarboxylate transporter receptor subunit TctC
MSGFARMVLLGAAMATTAFATLSHAQSLEPLPARNGYPSEPIRFVSPFPPGGGNDATTRWVTSRVMEVTGQPAVVENRGGAGGNIGAKAVASAKPDGYTVLTGQVSLMGVNPAIYSDAGFNPLKDFQPVTQVNAAPRPTVSLICMTPSPARCIRPM